MRPTCMLLALTLTVAVAPAAGPAAKIDFNRDVRPILSDNCFRCHGPDAEHREADLRLDVEASAKAIRDGKAAVVPGKLDRSELVRRITSRDADVQMPPPDSGRTLSPAQIETLKRWVAAGGAWSQPWAYVKPRRHAIPDVKDNQWSAGWSDRLLLSRMEAAGLRPSPPADRTALIRRLSFDLLGLPPTPAEVAAFVNDRRPDAYHRLVDRVLASPHFGERMAIYWLDLVRFADTVGYHGDQDHSISPYRDWVIDAFNDGLPFDRFAAEQLAGDLLPNAGVDQLIASGYNRLLQTSHEGGVQPQEYLAIYAADRVRNVSAVWLGGTLGCAQCHDHKYDPYTARDFYSMAAFFADVDETGHFKKGTNSLPTARPPELKVLTPRERHRADWLQREIRTETDAARLKELRTELAALRKNARRTMITQSVKPRAMRILPRGNWLDDSGPIVQPAAPAFLSTGNQPTRGRKQRLTRLDLANWLTDRNRAGGLTARVMVNRLWYLFFGRGIAARLDDFGGQGEPPVHPELLDNLAIEFLDSGWDLKHMVRLIVVSRAYRQSSLPAGEDRDPENRLFARQSRFRLQAEMVRDNALAVGGLLVRELGGASVKPYQPASYYRHLNFPKRSYRPHTDRRQWRRGVYVHWQRQFLHPMLKALDAPSREECTAERPRSNTPLAALTLLNDPTFIKAARGFAERILTEGGRTNESRLDYAFRIALSRSPDAFERKVLLDLFAGSTSGPAARSSTADRENAGWTTVARAILNLNEAVARN